MAVVVGCGPAVAVNTDSDQDAGGSSTSVPVNDTATTEVPTPATSTLGTTDAQTGTTLLQTSTTESDDSSTGTNVCACGPRALEELRVTYAPGGAHTALGTTITAGGDVWSLRRLFDPPSPVVVTHAMSDGDSTVVPLADIMPFPDPEIWGFAGADDGFILVTASSQDPPSSDLVLFDRDHAIQCVQTTDRDVDSIVMAPDGSWVLQAERDVGHHLGSCEEQARWIDDAVASDEELHFARWIDDTLWMGGLRERGSAPYIQGLSVSTGRTVFTWEAPASTRAPHVDLDFDGTHFYVARGGIITTVVVDVLDVETSEMDHYEYEFGFLVDMELLLDDPNSWLLLETDDLVEIQGIGEECCAQTLVSKHEGHVNSVALRNDEVVVVGLGPDLTATWFGEP